MNKCQLKMNTNVFSLRKSFRIYPLQNGGDLVQVSMDLLPDTQNRGLRMRWECRVRFPRHLGLAVPTCITARAWGTWRDACWDR